MAELNLNNLTLDDNTFDTLPDGDYRFTVDSHEFDYYSGNSTKIPPNTQQVICYLAIPYEKDGEVKTAKVKNTLNIYSKGLWADQIVRPCLENSSAMKCIRRKSSGELQLISISSRPR